MVSFCTFFSPLLFRFYSKHESFQFHIFFKTADLQTRVQDCYAIFSCLLTQLRTWQMGRDRAFLRLEIKLAKKFLKMRGLSLKEVIFVKSVWSRFFLFWCYFFNRVCWFSKAWKLKSSLKRRNSLEWWRILSILLKWTNLDFCDVCDFLSLTHLQFYEKCFGIYIRIHAKRRNRM